MINFKFIKIHKKTLIILISIFFFLSLTLLVPLFLPENFGFSGEHTDGPGDSSSATTLFSFFFYGISGFVLMFAFNIFLVYFIFIREIYNNSIGCWLTTQMSRKTILNSKIFTIIFSNFILIFSLLILELIFFKIRYSDFNSLEIYNIILINFSFFCLIILWAAIVWFVLLIINNATVSLSLISTLLILFCLFASLSATWDFVNNSAHQHGANADGTPLSFLRYFKYFTITSFFNLPFTFFKVVKPSALDYAWQIPFMILGSFSFFSLGNYIFIRKNLYL